MAFGNVNVKYKPCKSVGQLKSAANYILGLQPEQINDGIVKTRDNLYTALGCSRDNFANSILVTRKLNGKSYSRLKDRDIIAHKLSISFHPDDNEILTPDMAYKIAGEFAEKFMYSKGYEVLYAVHTDTEHIHVHFIVSNCNTETGKSFRRNKQMLFEISKYFGEQCIKHGLTHSVRDEFYNHDLERSRDNLTFTEYQMRKKGKESFKDELREVIQVEIADSANKTFDDVMLALWRHYNVETRVTGNTVSYRHPEYKDKNGNLVSVRGSKLGDLYTRKGIEYELTKERTRQYEQSAEIEHSRTTAFTSITSDETSESTDNPKRNVEYGVLGNDRENMAAHTNTSGGQLKRRRRKATAYGISDDDRGNIKRSDDFYERYAKRHKDAEGRTDKSAEPAKDLYGEDWDRDR